MNNMKKKNIVVIGGSSGIGLKTSLHLEGKGYDVLVGSRKKVSNGLKHKYIDVSKEETILDFFSNIKSLYGLIFSVGVTLPKSHILDFNREKYDTLFSTNVTGAILTIKYAYESLELLKAELL